MPVDVAGLAEAGRAIASDLQQDNGTITRKGAGSGVLNPVSGVFSPPAATTVYSGQCRVRKPTTAMEQEIVFGDINTTVSRFIVNLPYDAPIVDIDDVFTLTASDDSQILGVPMRVATIVGKSVLMYRQLGVEVIDQ